MRTYESTTGTVHVVNRYEEPGDEDTINAITRCGNSYEVNEINEHVDIDESELCGNCT